MIESGLTVPASYLVTELGFHEIAVLGEIRATGLLVFVAETEHVPRLMGAGVRAAYAMNRSFQLRFSSGVQRTGTW